MVSPGTWYSMVQYGEPWYLVQYGWVSPVVVGSYNSVIVIDPTSDCLQYSSTLLEYRVWCGVVQGVVWCGTGCGVVGSCVVRYGTVCLYGTVRVAEYTN